ncbi:MAG: ABC transporter substrate-binding protein, partial [Caldivirga sp.]
WNPWTPGNLLWWIGNSESLAWYNVFDGQFLPVLASNWTVITYPNGSAAFIIHVRKGLYWFNGSATIPFTAWDLYAEFYIGAKAFRWFIPNMNQTMIDNDIKILDNYTIELFFQKWVPTTMYGVLTTWINTPYPVWKWAVEALKTMNATQAMVFGSNNISSYPAPLWT